MAKRTRASIPIPTQLEVFFRDHWLCTLCGRPTIFPFALKQLAELVAKEHPDRLVEYFHPTWRRDAAPLLDELSACVDHVVPLFEGGVHSVENFATACARCNQRKGTRSRRDFLALSTPWTVKGKYGEPSHWDGLSSVFSVLSRRTDRKLTTQERAWLRGLDTYWALSGQ